MKLNKQKVITELKSISTSQMEQLDIWEKWTAEQLNQKPANGGWSILECMEHLRRYMERYIPEIQKAIKSGARSQQSSYRSGWLGNYSAESMLPKHKRSRKMKTFKSKNPEGELIDPSVLGDVRMQLNQMKELLDAAQPIDWNRARVKTTLGAWIKFKLGDIFRFLIYHNLRHFEQARRIHAS